MKPTRNTKVINNGSISSQINSECKVFIFWISYIFMYICEIWVWLQRWEITLSYILCSIVRKMVYQIMKVIFSYGCQINSKNIAFYFKKEEVKFTLLLAAPVTVVG